MTTCRVYALPPMRVASTSGILIWLLFVVAVAASGCAPALARRPVITATDHPRLYFAAADLPKLRARAQSDSFRIWANIALFSRESVGSALPLEMPTDDALNHYRNAGNLLIPLALDCALHDDTKVCERTKTLMLTYASWMHWGEHGWRDLGHAHMLLGNALAYDWMYDKLTSSERGIVKERLGYWAQSLYEAATSPFDPAWNNWWPFSYAQNHSWTAYSALGVAGMALHGEDNRSSEWISLATARLSHVRDLLTRITDGSWHESIPYQSYGLTMVLPFWYNLRRLAGQDDLPHRYLSNYGAWRLYNHLPSQGGLDRFILAYGNFAWSWADGFKPRNLLRFVAAEYHDPVAQWLAGELDYRDPPNVYSAPWDALGFLYGDDSVAPDRPDRLPNSRIFADLGAIVWRTGWQDSSLVFALKNGPFGGNAAANAFFHEQGPWNACRQCELNVGHDHADANSFYLFGGGRWLAPSVKRYDELDTEFSNTVLVDGKGQWRPAADDILRSELVRSQGGTAVETAASTQMHDYLVSDATLAYDQAQGVTRFIRQVVFVRPSYFVMVDDVSVSAPRLVEWLSHFGVKAMDIAMTESWVRGGVSDKQALHVLSVLPDKPHFRLGGHIDDTGVESGYVAISPSNPTTETRFVNILFPPDGTAWVQPPHVESTGNNASQLSIRVRARAEGALDEELLFNYDYPRSVVNRKGISSDSRNVVVRRNAGSVAQIFMAFGSQVRLDDTTFVRGWTGSGLEVTYAVGGIEVIAADMRPGSELTIRAPNSTFVSVNGATHPYVQSDEFVVITF